MWHASVNHDVEAYQIKSKSLVLKLWVASPFQYKRQHACSDLWGPCDLTPHCFCDQLSHYFFCLRFQEQHATSCSISALSLHYCVLPRDSPWWAPLLPSRLCLVTFLLCPWWQSFLFLILLLIQANSYQQRMTANSMVSNNTLTQVPTWNGTL